MLLLCIAYAFVVGSGPIDHFDHALYADTIRYMKAGESYYDAHLRAFADQGIEPSELRSIRQPAVFLLWRLMPLSLLWPTYVLVVVAATCFLMIRLTRSPVVVIAVAAYLLFAGRIPPEPVIEQWLLVELWTLPVLTASAVCWHRGRHGEASALAAVAVLMRETAIGFLAVGFVWAWWKRDVPARIRWSIGALGALVGYAVHASLALPRLAGEGQDAAILGTGDPPRTIWEMAAWMIPGPDAIGAAVMAVGVVHIVRHRMDLAPLLGLFALAGAGIFVARPYWGFLFTPFGILMFGEAVSRRLNDDDPTATTGSRGSA